MELLFVAGVAIVGLAALLQSKTLPSEADFKKAKEKLDANPVDPEANNIVGKYLAFVSGDYSGAMPYLVHSPDKTLRTLAEHELDASSTDTAPKKVGMGDEWIAAGKSLPSLSKIFYDRAAQWYALAWPDLDAVWKDKARIQGRKLSVARPAGIARKGLPQDWIADVGVYGRPPVLDGAVARTGSYSVKIPPPDEKMPNSLSALRTAFLPVTGKVMEASAYIFADGTENAADRIMVRFYDTNGTQIGQVANFYPTDTPFWTRAVIKADVPAGAVRFDFVAVLYSRKGTMWIDDVSVKFDGKEAIKNSSFEEK